MISWANRSQSVPTDDNAEWDTHDRSDSHGHVRLPGNDGTQLGASKAEDFEHCQVPASTTHRGKEREAQSSEGCRSERRSQDGRRGPHRPVIHDLGRAEHRLDDHAEVVGVTEGSGHLLQRAPGRQRVDPRADVDEIGLWASLGVVERVALYRRDERTRNHGTRAHFEMQHAGAANRGHRGHAHDAKEVRPARSAR